MAGNYIEVARATVTLVPNIAGSHGEIEKQLTGVTKQASEKAGEEGGSAFGAKFSKAIKAGTAVIAGAIAGATTAAVATGKAFVKSAKDVAAYGDEVDKTSQKLGLSAKSYQEWDYVMNIAGTEMSSMTTGLKTLTNKLDEAKNGSKDAQAMFAALGLSMDDLANMSREELFTATITGFQGMADSTERAALANDLFGKSGQNLAPLFNMTAEQTRGLIDQANEYGMVMDDTAVKASADFTDSMTTLNKTMTGVKNSLMSSFLPGLTEVTNGLAAVFAGKGEGIGQVEKGLQNVIGTLSAAAPKFLSLASTLVSSLLAGFAPMLPSLVSELFNFINRAILTITALIPQLTPVITLGLQQVGQALFTALPVLLTALLQMTQDIVVWLASGDNVKMFVDGILQLCNILAEGLGAMLPVLLPAIVNIIGQIADSLTDPDNVNMIIQSTLYIIGAVAVAIFKAFPEVWNVVVKLLSNLGQLLVGWGVQSAQNVIAWFGNISQKVVGFTTEVKNKISSWWSNLVNTAKTKMSSFVTNIVNTFKSLPSKVTSIGKDIIQGLINGVKSLATNAVNTVKNIGKNMVSGIKSVLKIGSPSKVFAQIGAWTAEGFGIGYNETMDDVQDDITSSLNGMTGNLTADVKAYGTANAGMLEGGATINSGGNTINVYAREGQDVKALADEIAIRLEDMTRRKAAVYG